MGCSGIFPLGAFFFALLGCATPRGEVGGFPACVWAFCGVVCLWGFGAGWGARGACGGLLTRVEGGGFDFFLPKKGPTGPVSAGPAGPRRDQAGAKEGAKGSPAPRRRVPQRHLACTQGAAHRRSRMRSMVTKAVSKTIEEEPRVLEKDYHPPPRPNASSRSSRNVPELCTYEPPSTTWTPPLAFSSATFVASS